MKKGGTAHRYSEKQKPEIVHERGTERSSLEGQLDPLKLPDGVSHSSCSQLPPLNLVFNTLIGVVWRTDHSGCVAAVFWDKTNWKEQ